MVVMGSRVDLSVMSRMCRRVISMDARLIVLVRRGDPGGIAEELKPSGYEDRIRCVLGIRVAACDRVIQATAFEKPSVHSFADTIAA